MSNLLEFVPNFSEGKDQSVVDSLVATMTAVPGVTCLGAELDGALVSRRDEFFARGPGGRMLGDRVPGSEVSVSIAFSFIWIRMCFQK